MFICIRLLITHNKNALLLTARHQKIPPLLRRINIVETQYTLYT